MTAVAQSASTKPSRGSARLAKPNAAFGLACKQGWSASSVDQLRVAAGVTKGAFFHQCASKDELGVAATERWSDVTDPLFAKADDHQHVDPLDRIFGYIAFRAAIANGPLEALAHLKTFSRCYLTRRL